MGALLPQIPAPDRSLSPECSIRLGMACPERTELETAHNDALRIHEQSLNTARTGVTRDQMQGDTLDKAVAVQNAYDALTGHIKGCPICEGN
jgi:hypothetical protein